VWNYSRNIGSASNKQNMGYYFFAKQASLLHMQVLFVPLLLHTESGGLLMGRSFRFLNFAL
jgi:hypothetical protein